MASETPRAIEAILMVADAPGRTPPAGPAARGLAGPGRGAVRRAGGVLPRRGPGVRAGPGGAAATGSRATPTWPPTSSASCSKARSARLSAAALETLAIVAYKQPVSRAQIAAIRGVNADGVMRTLQPAGLRRRGGPRPGSRARRCCTAPPRCCSSGWAWTASRSCRRWPSSCPARRSWTPSSTALRADRAGDPPAERRHDAGRRRPTRHRREAARTRPDRRAGARGRPRRVDATADDDAPDRRE